MDLRPYATVDRAACLAVFDSNMPAYFEAAERPRFEAFLDAAQGPYFVMEHDGDVVGCGGYAIESEAGLASLTWGMVRADLHRNGLGRFLLMYRLREISKTANVARVRLSTTPRAAGFYEKQGFRTGGADAQGLIEMVKKLTVCA